MRRTTPSRQTVFLGGVVVSCVALGIVSVSCASRKFNVPKSGAQGRGAPLKLVSQLPETHAQWLEEIERREKAYNAYFLEPTDPVAKDWYFNKPLGVSGLPYLVQRVLIIQFPEIWTGLSAGDKSRKLPPSFYNRLGLSPRPEDYEGDAIGGWSGKLKEPGLRNPLPYGFAMAKDFTTDPGSVPGSLNVFFSCAACHTSRVAMDGKVRFYPGGSGAQAEVQLLSRLNYETSRKFSNVEEFAEGKVRADQVKPKSAAHFFNTVNFLRLLGGFQCVEKTGRNGKVTERSHFMPHLHDGTAQGGKAYQDSIKECLNQKALLFGKTKPMTTVEQVQASLAGVTFDVDLLNSKPPTLLDKAALAAEAVANFKDPNSNVKKLLQGLVGRGVKIAMIYQHLGKASSFAEAPGEATPDFGPHAKQAPLAFAEINRSRREKNPPNLYDERPGQMDAFGLVLNIIYLSAARPDNLMFKYFPSQVREQMRGTFADSYFEGYDKTPEYQESIAWAGQDPIDRTVMNASRGTLDSTGKPNLNGRVHKQMATWVSQAAALSDNKSLFRSEEEVHANWDGNEGIGARVLASGLSSVTDPTKVFTEIHETQNAYIMGMPAPVYPFAEVKSPTFFDQARQGQDLFNASCAQCHHRQNAGIFNVNTDPNRAHVVYSPFARMSLVALTQIACAWGKQREALREQTGEIIEGLGTVRYDRRSTPTDPNAPYWCEMEPAMGDKPAAPFPNYKAQTEDMLRTYRGNDAGYKADALYGVWQDAPYLHNGSVPTLRLLLERESIRDVAAKSFVRGNIYYNEKEGGFEYKEHLSVGKENALPQARNVLQKDDAAHTAIFDTEKRGNSNGGHEFFHDEITFDGASRTWKGTGREWSAQERDAVVQYLKTL